MRPTIKLIWWDYLYIKVPVFDFDLVTIELFITDNNNNNNYQCKVYKFVKIIQCQSSYQMMITTIIITQQFNKVIAIIITQRFIDKDNLCIKVTRCLTNIIDHTYILIWWKKEQGPEIIYGIYLSWESNKWENMVLLCKWICLYATIASKICWHNLLFSTCTICPHNLQIIAHHWFTRHIIPTTNNNCNPFLSIILIQLKKVS